MDSHYPKVNKFTIVYCYIDRINDDINNSGSIDISKILQSSFEKTLLNQPISLLDYSNPFSQSSMRINNTGISNLQ